MLIHKCNKKYYNENLLSLKYSLLENKKYIFSFEEELAVVRIITTNSNHKQKPCQKVSKHPNKLNNHSSICLVCSTRYSFHQ